MKEPVREWLIFGAFATVLLAGVIAYWLPSCRRWQFGQAIHETRQFLSGLSTYHQMFGHYPDGDSATIMNALMGDNPTHTPILVPSRGATNQAGGWLDPWGTPYEVIVPPSIEIARKRSGPVLQQGSPVVKSAGPNKRFGDPDDIVMDWNKLTSSNKLP